METLIGVSRMLLLGSVLVLSILACAGAQEPALDSEVQQAYNSAIADAEVAEPSEIWDDLTPILPGETGTRWEESDGKSYVLTVTWTSWDGYDGATGSTMELSRDVWITLVPEVAEFCSLVPEHVDLNLRLAQLLGLPPHDERRRFVEMWVRPDDLFRPCPDPATNDNRCELDFPPGTEVEHRQWFDRQHKASYSGQSPYPWTRLGYTYDWGGSSGEVGLSEYVIRKGARVGVRSVDSTRMYCQR